MCFYNIYKFIVESIYGKEKITRVILKTDEDNEIVYYEYE